MTQSNWLVHFVERNLGALYKMRSDKSRRVKLDEQVEFWNSRYDIRQIQLRPGPLSERHISPISNRWATAVHNGGGLCVADMNV